MENNFIESLLLYDGAIPLGRLLTERFNVQAHLAHLSSSYAIHFILGLSPMLLSDDVRAKYGVRAVFFTNFGEEKIVRLTILVDKKSVGDTSGQRSMKVITFDMTGNGTGKRILLSTDENKVMKLLLSGKADNVPANFTRTIEDLYRNDQELEKIDLDQYPASYAVYAMYQEEMLKLDQLDTQTRTKLNFFENFSHRALKKQFAKHYVDISRYLVPSGSNRFEFAHPGNKIVLLTRTKMITDRGHADFDANAVPTLFEQYFNAHGAVSLEKFQDVLTGHNGLGEIFRNISLTSGITAECGFTHGSLFFLSYFYPSFIEVRQKIGTALYTPGFEMTIDPSTEMLFIYKPKFTGSEHSLHQIPIVCFLPRHYCNPKDAVDRVPTAMSIMGEVGGISVRLHRNTPTSRLSILQKRPNFINFLSDLIEKRWSQPNVLAELIRLQLNKVRSPLREYNFSERNYLSQYLTGWIMSSQNEQCSSYRLVSESGDTTTKFMIELSKVPPEMQSIPSKVLLVVREETLSENHAPDAVSFEESYERDERLDEEDVVVVKIRQEYVHSRSDFLTTEFHKDFTRFVVTVSFASTDEVLKSYAPVALPKVPRDLFDSLADGDSPVGKVEKKLTPLLQPAAKFLETTGDYEAFLDGIFLDNECMKSMVDEKNIHSDVFYIRKAGPHGELLKLNFRILPDRIINEKFMQIVQRAYREMLSPLWQDKGQFFQFILSKRADVLNIKIFDAERLSLFAQNIESLRENNWEEFGIEAFEALNIQKHETTKKYETYM